MLEYYFYLAGCLFLIFFSFVCFSIITESCRSLHAKLNEAAKKEKKLQREQQVLKFRNENAVIGGFDKNK
jgi:hypothetical protein